MRPSAISPCHFDHISVSLLVPFRWSDIPATRLLDSKRVNPESKGLTRFNPESTHGLNVVNPESTPALTASTPGLAGQPRPPSQKCERPQPETSGCGDHINTIAKKRRIVKRNLQQKNAGGNGGAARLILRPRSRSLTAAPNCFGVPIRPPSASVSGWHIARGRILNHPSLQKLVTP